MAVRPESAPISRRLIWTLRLGCLFVAGAALWRVSLYVFSLTNDVPLALPAATLTFMPIPDALFTAVFLWLAVKAGEPMRPAFLETGIIASALHAAALVSYALTFHGWTEGKAFALTMPSTWVHAILPAGYCIWLAFFLLRLGWRLRRLSARQ